MTIIQRFIAGKMGYQDSTRLPVSLVFLSDPESAKASFEKYKQLDLALPALGYSDKQLEELQEVINTVDCDVVLSATPIDITRVIKVDKPIVRVKYASKEVDGTPLADMVKKLAS